MGVGFLHTRLGAPSAAAAGVATRRAANRLLLTLKDSVPFVRSLAAWGFTRGYADAAKLAPGTVSDLLVLMGYDAMNIRTERFGPSGA